jgi:hypothetical protein
LDCILATLGIEHGMKKDEAEIRCNYSSTLGLLNSPHKGL